MSVENPKVDAFLEDAPRWKNEMQALRSVLLECGLTEELKWGKPCYTAHDGNIVIMQPFKPHLSLMFFKGALLDDPEGLLRAQGENTRSALRMEFTGVEDVSRRSAAIGAYVDEAIAVEKAGLKVPEQKADEDDVPAELTERFDDDPAYREAFDRLTPGRKRSYLLHFSGAKQAETRSRRIERCRKKVLEGKGFNER